MLIAGANVTNRVNRGTLDNTENMPPTKINSENATAILANYEHILFDCDGVLWLGDDAIPNVKDTVSELKKQGKTFAFVSNNSSASRNSYDAKFKRLGYEGLEKSQFFPTCYAAATCLKEKLNIPVGSKVWVLGDQGIEVELKEAGYLPLGGTDPKLDTAFDPSHELLVVDKDVKAVVVGSTKQFNYMRIALTLQYLLADNKSIPFIGTNIDRTYPGPGGLILPAGGSVVEYMAYTADRTFIDVGKPSQVLLDAIIDHCKFDRSKTLMVGDTLYTDIKFGNDGKLGGSAGSSLLVLTGGTKESQVLEQTDTSLVPAYYVDSFGDLLKYLSAK